MGKYVKYTTMKVYIYHYLDKNIKYVIPYRCLILAL